MFFVNFLSLLSEFDFEAYKPWIMNTQKKKRYIYFMHKFKFGPNFISWPSSAACCQDDSAEAHWLEIRVFCLIHHLPLISQPLTTIWSLFFMRKKTVCSKWEVETKFNDFIALKFLEFYHTSINHHHHVVLLAWIFLTLSRHSSLSFIASGRSSRLHPISSQSYFM